MGSLLWLLGRCQAPELQTPPPRPEDTSSPALLGPQAMAKKAAYNSSRNLVFREHFEGAVLESLDS